MRQDSRHHVMSIRLLLLGIKSSGRGSPLFGIEDAFESFLFFGIHVQGRRESWDKEERVFWARKKDDSG